MSSTRARARAAERKHASGPSGRSCSSCAIGFSKRRGPGDCKTAFRHFATIGSHLRNPPGLRLAQCCPRSRSRTRRPPCLSLGVPPLDCPYPSRGGHSTHRRSTPPGGHPSRRSEVSIRSGRLWLRRMLQTASTLQRGQGPGHQFDLKRPGVHLQTEPRGRLLGNLVCVDAARTCHEMQILLV